MTSTRRARIRSLLDRLSYITLVAYPVVAWFALTSLSARLASLVLLAMFLPAISSRLMRSERSAVVAFAWLPLLSVALLSVAALLGSSGLPLLVPVVINGALLATFGTTLRLGPPMVERIARLKDGDLTDAEVLWCRQWTTIWCVFFAGNALIAGTLAFAAPLRWWTAWNGAIAYVIMGLLFAVEYAIRKRRFGRFGDHALDRTLRRLFGRSEGP